MRNLNIGRLSIVDVVARYTSLRRSGREYLGLCPFHSEKTPSFSVNEEKGVFHCFGCGESGDLIRFIEKIEGISFLEALALLGLRRDQIPGPQNDAVKRLAATVSAWANEQFDKAQILLREIGQRERIAQELGWREEVERCSRECVILADLSDDLQDPQQVMELWAEGEAIEAILADAPDDPLPTYLTITSEYRARLQAMARGNV